MKTKKLDALLVWKQIEDDLVPRLRLNLVERVVYYHLLRHSRLEGKVRLHFSILWLAQGMLVSTGTARDAVRRLVGKGALRLVERTKAGHVIEVRLPEEIRTVRVNGDRAEDKALLPRAGNLEEMDFLETKELRETIHRREGRNCFYCLRQLTARGRCIDHVVPRVRGGNNSYRNLVSCCADCNSQKGEEPAEDFLRRLYRQRRLTADDLENRLRALDALAAGSLRPVLPTPPPSGRGPRASASVGARFSSPAQAGASQSASPGKRFPVWSQSISSNSREIQTGGTKGERRSVRSQAPLLLGQGKPYLTGSPPSRRERRYRPDVECPEYTSGKEKSRTYFLELAVYARAQVTDYHVNQALVAGGTRRRVLRVIIAANHAARFRHKTRAV